MPTMMYVNTVLYFQIKNRLNGVCNPREDVVQHLSWVVFFYDRVIENVNKRILGKAISKLQFCMP